MCTTRCCPGYLRTLCTVSHSPSPVEGLIDKVLSPSTTSSYRSQPLDVKISVSSSTQGPIIQPRVLGTRRLGSLSLPAIQDLPYLLPHTGIRKRVPAL